MTNATANSNPRLSCRVVRLLADSAATSLLDHDEDAWLANRTVDPQRHPVARPCFCYAHRAVADLAEAGGWEAEYPRDVWRMHRLGFDGRPHPAVRPRSPSPGCGS